MGIVFPLARQIQKMCPHASWSGGLVQLLGLCQRVGDEHVQLCGGAA